MTRTTKANRSAALSPLRFFNGILLCVSVAVLISSCGYLLTKQPEADQLLDGPIEGLTSTQLALHIQGDVEFNRTFTADDGLGPIFNSQSCVSCHVRDGRGHSTTTLLRFGRSTATGFDPLTELGGPQLQNKAVTNFTAETIPVAASVFSNFLPPAITGLGYLEAVDDSTLLALQDPNDANGDGISGIISTIPLPEYVELGAHRRTFGGSATGRFGRKAAAVDLLHQTVNALINDMGLSSDFHMKDVVNLQQGNHSGDAVSDPEIPAAKVRSIVWYLRTLKIPPRRNVMSAAVLRGEQTFTTIGCASCHVATMTTAPSDISVLSRVVIHPYTDLLLHDMGDELNDGYTEGSAAPSEWRTTPLWGLGLSGVSAGGAVQLLHDGRAKTLADAIRFHGGESASSRAKFQKLGTEEQQDLFRFLESL